MFRKFALGLIAALILVGANIAHAQPAYIQDRCITGLHQSVPFNISSATDTSIVALSTGTNIYVCHFDLNQAGGTGTVLFEYGTGATCGTGQVLLTGPFTANTAAGTTTNIAAGNGTSTLFSTNTAGALVPSQRLCIKSTGTIVQSGYVTFVQE